LRLKIDEEILSFIGMEKEYTNGEITVVWQNKKCIHSTNCVTDLSHFFNTKSEVRLFLMSHF